MAGSLVAVIGAITAILGGAGVWGYLSLRRTTSGGIETSESKQLWDAREQYESRLDGQLEKMSEHITRLDADYQRERKRGDEESRMRIDCERRITHLEATTDAAVIISSAKLEAEKIRKEAAVAREVLEAAAVRAKAELEDG